MNPAAFNYQSIELYTKDFTSYKNYSAYPDVVRHIKRIKPAVVIRSNTES